MKICKLNQANTELPWALLLEADPERKVVEKYIDQSTIFVAKEAENIVGVLAIMKLDSTEACQYELMNVSVDPLFQRRGIATKLMEHAFKWVMETIKNQVDSVVLYVKTGDISPALQLYKDNGFVIEAIQKNYFLEHYAEPIYEEGQQLKNQVLLKKVMN
ncbi:GNAT family N-acetyltransferase [Vagococcus entomophilus]|uniref:N-acetyltransferase domain-containing protein n=1 Tax=Vagococcus entomophilus TaxID=1160095 RepID=A0A430AJV3_9ENTE|nr:GNAT family N-acetyltransferase [Vagococcus entomophilus]RSU08375.1 hypothetical protein CBF30_03815 [Vagococcus entomophilus]